MSVVQRKHIVLRFSSNTEGIALELLENPEEMFPRHSLSVDHEQVTVLNLDMDVFISKLLK